LFSTTALPPPFDTPNSLSFDSFIDYSNPYFSLFDLSSLDCTSSLCDVAYDPAACLDYLLFIVFIQYKTSLQVLASGLLSLMHPITVVCHRVSRTWAYQQLGSANIHPPGRLLYKPQFSGISIAGGYADDEPWAIEAWPVTLDEFHPFFFILRQ
jgi:hypothetical protein